ncbi:MAG: hypothetical protein H7243_01495 [Sphingomonadaceae bacterium]|nr:hypothetical protein [Sphingomonadaceae bacterium]
MVQPIIAVSIASGVVLFVAAPLLIALVRRHPERGTIARLTPFAALSFVLWTALLMWALFGKRDDGVIAHYVARLRERRLLPLIVGTLVVVGAIGSALTFLR